MSTHNICFCGEIRKICTFLLEKASYQELCLSNQRAAARTLIRLWETIRYLSFSDRGLIKEYVVIFLGYFFLFLHKNIMLWVLIRNTLLKHF